MLQLTLWIPWPTAMLSPNLFRYLSGFLNFQHKNIIIAVVLYHVNYSKLELWLPELLSLYFSGLRCTIEKSLLDLKGGRKRSSHYALKIGVAWQVLLKHKCNVHWSTTSPDRGGKAVWPGALSGPFSAASSSWSPGQAHV